MDVRLFEPLFGNSMPRNSRFDVTALLKIARISEAQLSPDGKLIAFTAPATRLDAKPRWALENGWLDGREYPQFSKRTMRKCFCFNIFANSEISYIIRSVVL